MPSTEPSSSAWYSPEPACSTAGSRIERKTVKAAIRIAISEIEIARSSSRSEPLIRSVESSPLPDQKAGGRRQDERGQRRDRPLDRVEDAR